MFTYVVLRGLPFTRTTDPLAKLDPDTVIERPFEPAGALDGETDVIVGTPRWPPSEIRAHPVIDMTRSDAANTMLIRDIILSTSW